MVSLFDLGNDVLKIIIANVDVSGYYALAVSCSRLNNLCRLFVNEKKSKATSYHEHVYYDVKNKCEKKIYYYKLPNGWKHGSYLEYAGDKLVKSCSYQNNILDGKMQNNPQHFFCKDSIVCYYKLGLLHGKFKGIIGCKKKFYHYYHGKKNGKYYKIFLGFPIEEGEYRYGLLLWRKKVRGINYASYNYRNGKKHGYFAVYHEGDISPFIEGYYFKGKKCGLWKNHDRNSTQYYFNGKKQGYYHRYHQGSSDKIDVVVAYHQGKKHGKFLRYYEDGTLNTECYFRQGKKHGKFLRYYEDGTLNTECYFRHGLRVGKYQHYHTNGKIKIECYFKGDKPDGRFLRYSDTGQLLDDKYFKHGHLDGKSYHCMDKNENRYHDGKRIKYIICYYQNKFCCSRKYYYADDTTKKVYYYMDGYRRKIFLTALYSILPDSSKENTNLQS